MLKKAKYVVNTNPEFKNNSAEFVYYWKCAETEIKKSYTRQIRSIDYLDKMAAIEAQEEETPKAEYVSQPEKDYLNDDLFKEFFDN